MKKVLLTLLLMLSVTSAGLKSAAMKEVKPAELTNLQRNILAPVYHQIFWHWYHQLQDSDKGLLVARFATELAKKLPETSETVETMKKILSGASAEALTLMGGAEKNYPESVDLNFEKIVKQKSRIKKSLQNAQIAYNALLNYIMENREFLSETESSLVQNLIDQGMNRKSERRSLRKMITHSQQLFDAWSNVHGKYITDLRNRRTLYINALYSSGFGEMVNQQEGELSMEEDEKLSELENDLDKKYFNKKTGENYLWADSIVRAFDHINNKLLEVERYVKYFMLDEGKKVLGQINKEIGFLYKQLPLPH